MENFRVERTCGNCYWFEKNTGECQVLPPQTVLLPSQNTISREVTFQQVVFYPKVLSSAHCEKFRTKPKFILD